MKKLIVATVAIHLFLGFFMYKAVEAVNIQNSLPKHDYPNIEQTLKDSDINPTAADHLEKLHSINQIPASFTKITIEPNAIEQPLTEFIRFTAIQQGGLASYQCRSRSDNRLRCHMKAAIPQNMAIDLTQMANATFDEQQAWIQKQPTAATWKDKQNDLQFTLTEIEVKQPMAKIGTWRARSHTIQLAGIAALIIGGIISVITIPTSYWIIFLEATSKPIQR